MFKRPFVRYGAAPGVETLYQRGRPAVRDCGTGSHSVRRLKNWRLAFFGMLAVSGGLAGGLVWQSARGTVTPWVVEVDKLGRAEAVAPAVADYQPTDPEIAWHLAHFIEEVRSIPADPVVLCQNWLDAYDYVTDKGALALNDYARRSDPFAEIGKTQVAVEVSSVIRASPDSFRGRLDRAALRRRRALAATERWSAILTIVIEPPSDADRLRKNPLGVYVHALELVEGAWLMRPLPLPWRLRFLLIVISALADLEAARGSPMTIRPGRRSCSPIRQSPSGSSPCRSPCRYRAS